MKRVTLSVLLLAAATLGITQPARAAVCVFKVPLLASSTSVVNEYTAAYEIVVSTGEQVDCGGGFGSTTVPNPYGPDPHPAQVDKIGHNQTSEEITSYNSTGQALCHFSASIEWQYRAVTFEVLPTPVTISKATCTDWASASWTCTEDKQGEANQFYYYDGDPTHPHSGYLSYRAEACTARAIKYGFPFDSWNPWIHFHVHYNGTYTANAGS